MTLRLSAPLGMTGQDLNHVDHGHELLMKRDRVELIARSLFRSGRWAKWDCLLVTLALVHAGFLLRWPSIAFLAAGIWWNANTISHYFIHRPFFRTRALNAVFSCYLSLLLGFPHSLWRVRHLRHHFAHEGRRKRGDMRLAPLDFLATSALWGALLVFAPAFAFAIYIPGFLIGLALCFLQGHYEHFGGTVSHYGMPYNLLFLNDGYHIEHHAHPGAHWRDLPQKRIVGAKTSRLPAVLRWLESRNLRLHCRPNSRLS